MDGVNQQKGIYDMEFQQTESLIFWYDIIWYFYTFQAKFD